MRSDRPDDWYDHEARRCGALDGRGMISFYHHQALWNNRQNPRIYGAFADIWGRDDLWVSMDRVNMNPPARSGWPFRGFVHFDIDTTQRPLPFHVQGVLSLSTTPVSGGGFRCAPGFHHHLEAWLDARPNRPEPRFSGLEDVECIEIPLNEGDLLIFNGALPHGTGPNISQSVRLAQYITMWPAAHRDPVEREERLDIFRRRRSPRSPAGAWLPTDPRGLEANRWAPVTLSDLGHKLLGSRRWDRDEID